MHAEVIGSLLLAILFVVQLIHAGQAETFDSYNGEPTLNITDNMLVDRNINDITIITKIAISDRRLTGIAADAFALLPNVKKINLSNNNLTADIHRNVFRGLPLLTHLDLSRNRLIRSLTADPWTDLLKPNLAHLDVTLTQLEADFLSLILSNYPSLSYLKASKLVNTDSIRNYSLTVSISSHPLKKLILSYNQLEMTDDSLNRLHNLSRLSLFQVEMQPSKDQFIKTLIENLPASLERLDLDNNEITYFNLSARDDLNQLSHLSLSKNTFGTLPSFPSVIYNNLVYLDLSKLRSTIANYQFPGTFKSLKTLIITRVGLNDDKLALFLSKVESNLEELNINGNNDVCKFPDLSRFGKLKTLQLNALSLTEIKEDDFTHFTNLTKLNVFPQNKPKALQCNCALAWLKRAAFYVTDSSVAPCAAPERLRSLTWENITYDLIIEASNCTEATPTELTPTKIESSTAAGKTDEFTPTIEITAEEPTFDSTLVTANSELTSEEITTITTTSPTTAVTGNEVTFQATDQPTAESAPSITVKTSTSIQDTRPYPLQKSTFKSTSQSRGVEIAVTVAETQPQDATRTKATSVDDSTTLAGTLSEVTAVPATPTRLSAQDTTVFQESATIQGTTLSPLDETSTYVSTYRPTTTSVESAATNVTAISTSTQKTPEVKAITTIQETRPSSLDERSIYVSTSPPTEVPTRAQGTTSVQESTTIPDTRPSSLDEQSTYLSTSPPTDVPAVPTNAQGTTAVQNSTTIPDTRPSSLDERTTYVSTSLPTDIPAIPTSAQGTTSVQDSTIIPDTRPSSLDERTTYVSTSPPTDVPANPTGAQGTTSVQDSTIIPDTRPFSLDERGKYVSTSPPTYVPANPTGAQGTTSVQDSTIIPDTRPSSLDEIGTYVNTSLPTDVPANPTGAQGTTSVQDSTIIPDTRPFSLDERGTYVSTSPPTDVPANPTGAQGTTAFQDSTTIPDIRPSSLDESSTYVSVSPPTDVPANPTRPQGTTAVQDSTTIPDTRLSTFDETVIFQSTSQSRGIESAVTDVSAISTSNKKTPEVKAITIIPDTRPSSLDERSTYVNTSPPTDVPADPTRAQSTTAVQDSTIIPETRPSSLYERGTFTSTSQTTGFETTAETTTNSSTSVAGAAGANTNKILSSPTQGRQTSSNKLSSATPTTNSYHPNLSSPPTLLPEVGFVKEIHDRRIRCPGISLDEAVQTICNYTGMCVCDLTNPLDTVCNCLSALSRNCSSLLSRKPYCHHTILFRNCCRMYNMLTQSTTTPKYKKKKAKTLIKKLNNQRLDQGILKKLSEYFNENFPVTTKAFDPIILQKLRMYFITPVEAPAAIYISVVAILFLALELVLIIASDLADHRKYKKYWRGRNKKNQKLKRKLGKEKRKKKRKKARNWQETDVDQPGYGGWIEGPSTSQLQQ